MSKTCFNSKSKVNIQPKGKFSSPQHKLVVNAS